MSKEFIQLVKILNKGVGRRNPFATPKLSPSKAKLDQLDNINTYQKRRFEGLRILHHWLILLQIIVMSVIGQYEEQSKLLFQRKK